VKDDLKFSFVESAAEVLSIALGLETFEISETVDRKNVQLSSTAHPL